MAIKLLTVLIQAKRTARVLNKQIQQPHLIVLNLWESLKNLICNQVRAPALGLEGKLLLRPHCRGTLAGFCVCNRRVRAAEERDQAERSGPSVVKQAWK